MYRPTSDALTTLFRVELDPGKVPKVAAGVGGS